MIRTFFVAILVAASWCQSTRIVVSSFTASTRKSFPTTLSTLHYKNPSTSFDTKDPVIPSSTYNGSSDGVEVPTRRFLLLSTCALAAAAASLLVTDESGESPTSRAIKSPSSTGLDAEDKDDFHGTSLPLLSLDDAGDLSLLIQQDTTADNEVFPFAQWPDPLLRRPASRVIIPDNNGEATTIIDNLRVKLQSIARTLQRTAHQKGAVGLAAQQCGIDVSMVYLQTKSLSKKWWQQNESSNDKNGIFLLNPRIVERSPEAEMKVWTEECLVLPPSFRATVLRDASVTIEYETIFPLSSSSSSSSDKDIFETKQMTLHGELARAAQHEMQHDEGILILDHVDLADLPSYMQDEEAQGHEERMERAFSRAVAGPTTKNVAMNRMKENEKQATTEDARGWNEAFVPRANAASDDLAGTLTTTTSTSSQETTNKECNEACLEERKRIIQERRAMMRQSRSNTNRQDLFQLSQQRATLYNTTYQGAKCPPGIPCL